MLHILGTWIVASLIAAGAWSALRFTEKHLQGCAMCGERARRYVRTDTTKTATCEQHAGPLAQHYASRGVAVLVTPID